MDAPDGHQVYLNKAEKYARYRWDYAPQVVQAIFDLAGLSASPVAADIGAGTGILTRHFAGRVGQIYAIEPNAEMRHWAELRLAGFLECKILSASAEATTLADHSIDLITVGQAIHWFDPGLSSREFQRILKPGGWLALLRNYGTDEDLNQAIAEISTEENGVRLWHSERTSGNAQVSIYFGHEDYRKMIFPFQHRQDWQAFLGGLLSASYMPVEGDPGYEKFSQAARGIFERYQVDGFLESRVETELLIGEVRVHK